jgi:hypothetical protein
VEIIDQKLHISVLSGKEQNYLRITVLENLLT